MNLILPTVKQTSTFVCKWCKHSFVRESRFINHTCKRMKRSEEIKSPRGQAAWNYYDMWMQAKKRQRTQAENFIDSNYYMTFNNFVNFAKAVSLPCVDKFIKLMVHRDYPPTMWSSDAVYAEYIEYLDSQLHPLEQAKLSIKTLWKMAETLNIDISEVFDVITSNELVHLLRARVISPWLLLFSPRFSKFFNTNTSPEQKVIIETLIRPEHWAEMFDQHVTEIEEIKQYIRELKL